ncbi:hypothetical protein NDU88_002891 [Pleurodeles waltl]|uniref:Uncharacterized protein n=1 Tax=Pleurodeles waltl TaxID=8319 RepID=A0AAV7M5B4_PLEWA|nr:hypothetical protein NDU88_002891 [Pleurodeles waltl]
MQEGHGGREQDAVRSLVLQRKCTTRNTGKNCRLLKFSLRSSAPQEVRDTKHRKKLLAPREAYTHAHTPPFSRKRRRVAMAACAAPRTPRALGEAVGRRYGCMCVLLSLRKKKEPLTSSRTRKQKYRDLKKENFSKNRSLIKM